MDAPPEKEPVAPFIGVAQSLLGIGLNVPVILARDPERGLLLLSDLGTRLYLSDLLAGHDVERLYSDALDALVRLQTRGGAAARALPPYDRAALGREIARIAASRPERIAILASGGMSHFPGTWKYPHPEFDFDRWLITELERGNADAVIELTVQQLDEVGNTELHAGAPSR